MEDLKQIIASIAEQECTRIASRVARDLRRVTQGMQSGDGSGLANLWDEVCVQVQDQESVIWDHYLDIMREMIEKRVEPLNEALEKAIWLQTEAGFDWLYSRPGAANRWSSASPRRAHPDRA